MKKLLLTAVSATILSSSAIVLANKHHEHGKTHHTPSCCHTASESEATMEVATNKDRWYVKLGAGATIFQREKSEPTRLKLKTNTGFIGELAVGYYIMDNVRTDLSFVKVLGAKLKKSGAVTTGPYTGYNASMKHLPNINALFVNGYYDFASVNIMKFFAGAGIGVAELSEEIKGAINPNSVERITKTRYNFAYQVSLGASAEVAPGINAELTYKWMDYGKTKSKNARFLGQDVKFGGTRYQGHNLIAGLRFDI